jgi:hypothetical protein
VVLLFWGLRCYEAGIFRCGRIRGLRTRTCQDIRVTDLAGCLADLAGGVAGFGFVVRRSFTGASRGGRSHRSGLYAFVYGFAELD